VELALYVKRPFRVQRDPQSEEHVDFTAEPRRKPVHSSHEPRAEHLEQRSLDPEHLLDVRACLPKPREFRSRCLPLLIQLREPIGEIGFGDEVSFGEIQESSTPLVYLM
jgi:hypothetical protein